MIYKNPETIAIQSTNNLRDDGLDYIKAIAITLVLGWHLMLIKLSYVDNNFITKLISISLSIFAMQICLLAVPLFLIVSLYLYHQKGNQNIPYTKKRLLGLTKLFLFWQGIQLIIYFVVKAANTILGLNLEIPPLDLVSTILGLHPDLPIVGTSVFYFLFVLIILTSIYSLLINYRTSRNPQALFYISLAAIGISLVYLEYMNIYRLGLDPQSINGFMGYALSHDSIFNFLIYVPATYIIASKPDFFFRYRWYYALAFFIFGVQDHILGDKGIYEVLIYCRPSIFFGTIWLFSMLYPRKVELSSWMRYLAQKSLGLFAVHKYFQLIVILLFTNWLTIPTLKLNTLLGFEINLNFLLNGLIIVSLSLAFVQVMSLTPLKKFFS